MDLNTIWFVLVFVLLAGYAVLDGFDLGVGVLHLFARDEHERRIHLNAIGPVWDGNEVWLLTAGGALFAAFPVVYATVFSAYYLALMLLLAALIARAVAMEFRGKVESAGWKRTWDWAFALGSLLPAVLFGVAYGNVLRGLPLTSEHVFTGTFLGLLNPYAVGVGVLSLVVFTLHGALYLAVKSEGRLHERCHKWIPGLWVAAVVLYCAVTFATLTVAPFLFAGLLAKPMFWICLLLAIGGMVSIPVAAFTRRHATAFVASCAMIAGMLGVSAISLFPRLTPSTTDLANSLTIYNASSTPRTLTVMLAIALIGMPLVIGYTAFIYRAFKGKVVLTAEGY